MERSELIKELEKYPANTPVFTKDRKLFINFSETVDSVLKKLNSNNEDIVTINDFPITRVGEIGFTLSEDNGDDVKVTILILQNDNAEDYLEKKAIYGLIN